MTIEADAACRGNPGPSSYGAIVRNPDTGQAIDYRAGRLNNVTNNVAEYCGLIAGLVAAQANGATIVEVRLDSDLVVRQMKGEWRVRHPGLVPLHKKATTLARKFEEVSYAWVPRDRNKKADWLANAVLDRRVEERCHDVTVS